ncbi:MAG: sensor histidine kinase [Gammaproteobacteria bacterium]|nr:sensor histidine kinase [Gammaproteobacteria bacterium]
MTNYSNQSSRPGADSGPRVDASLAIDSPRMTQLVVPELCNVPAISLLFLFGELLVLVLLFAGGPVTWVRFALMSLFVQWVSITSAGLLCVSRGWLASFGLAQGSVLAFLLVMSVTLIVGLCADRILPSVSSDGVTWSAIAGQMVISGIITTLALRYFHVQHQLRVQEQSELQSRIQALQSRIRPHFLFNSMNIIASLIASDPETAESVVEDLSELFRASLNDAGSQVQLQEELDLCERYVRIESLRLGDRLRLEWDIEEPTQNVKIPLLTLQPLLENAIYHGVQPRPDGGTIGVRLWFSQDNVHVEITNPLPDENARDHNRGNKMALNNIRSRLMALYGTRASLSVATLNEQYVTSLKYPITVQPDEA